MWFQEGFREGIEEGQAATLQLGFDCGYNTAFKYFEITGMFRGLIRFFMLLQFIYHLIEWNLLLKNSCPLEKVWCFSFTSL